jgi:NAD(P)-dependent dehydrogenase (short-subunit alcohol dehydrogenase family)
MADMFRLDGKVAVVVGGAGSIGGSVALGFAQGGFRVSLVDTTQEPPV